MFATSSSNGSLQPFKGSYLSDELEFSDIYSGSYATQKQLKAEIQFVTKSEFENADSCLICNIQFEMLQGIKQHHCRSCGGSVCAPCSRRQINDNRVCDVCFVRCFLKKQERRRMEQLEQKETILSTLKEQKSKFQSDILETEHQILLAQEKRIQSNQDLKSKYKLKQEEYEESLKDLELQEQMLNNSEKQLRTDKQLLLDIEKELTNSGQRLKSLQIEIEQKKKVIADKDSQMNVLIQQREKLTSTKSFMQQFKNKRNTGGSGNDSGAGCAESDDDDEDEIDDNETGQENGNPSVTPGTTKRGGVPSNPQSQRRLPDHYRNSQVANHKTQSYSINQNQKESNKCKCSIF